MFNSKFSLCVVPLVFGSLWMQAQVMNEADEQRAREMLRQKIAERRTKELTGGTAAPSMPLTDEQRAREILRQRIAEARAKEAATTPMEPADASFWQRTRSAWRDAFTSDASPTEPMEASPSPAPAPAEPIGKTEKVSEVPTALPQQGERAPETPARGPKTKQQRLVELLERYKANQIEPIEYHEQRARILAEP